MYDRSTVWLDSPLFNGQLRDSKDEPKHSKTPVIVQQELINEIRIINPEPATIQETITPEYQAYDEPPMFPIADTYSSLHIPGQVIMPEDHVDISERPQPAENFNVPVHESPLVYVAEPSKTKHRINLKTPQLAFVVMGILVFAIGGYTSFVTLKANNKAVTQVTALTSSASRGTNASSTNSDNSAPSAVALTAEDISKYQVGPTKPRYIDIESLGVHARVKQLGINKSGALAAPSNVYDTGWYEQSSLPGENGAMLIDGHISSWTANGVFYNLKKLTNGDVIKIVRGDDKVFGYKVVKTELVNADDVDMSNLLLSAQSKKPGLNLISCSGEVIPGTNEFNKRLIVYTVLQ